MSDQAGLALDALVPDRRSYLVTYACGHEDWYQIVYQPGDVPMPGWRLASPLMCAACERETKGD